MIGEGALAAGVSVDVVKFFSGRPEAERTAEDLTQLLLLPTLFVRYGLPWRTELDASLHPGGLRLGGRAQLAGNERTVATVSAEAGVTLAWMADVTEAPDRNVRFLLLPDAALLAGASPVRSGEAYVAARYLWLREKIAGPDFVHTPALTAGYLQTLGPVQLGGEVSAFWAPGTGSVAVAPGLSIGSAQ